MTTEQDPGAALRATSAATAGCSRAAPILDTRTGVAAAAEQWSNAARPTSTSTSSRVELLDVAQQRPGPPAENAAGTPGVGADAGPPVRRGARRAAPGRPRAARRPGTTTSGRDHLVLATCRAALGDDDGPGRGSARSPRWCRPPSGPAYLAHCLLRVGDARGDHGLSEASLGQLQRLGDKGRRVLPAHRRRRRSRVVRGPDPPVGPGATPLWGSARGQPGQRTRSQESAGVPAGRHRPAAQRLGVVRLRPGAGARHRRAAPAAGRRLQRRPAAARRRTGPTRTSPASRRRSRRTCPRARAADGASAAALLLGLGAIAFLVSGVAGYPTLALVWAICSSGPPRSSAASRA